MYALIIYGPPGAGKGTQANLLADALDGTHIDTGKYLEEIVNDPARQNDPVIQHEKKLFDEGLLLTPGFVLPLIKARAAEVGRARMSVIFSGIPRTLYDAFGDATTIGLLAELEKYYKKNNIVIIYLETLPELSLTSNSSRLVCSVCSRPVLNRDRLDRKYCDFCGGELRKRSLDNPEAIKVRLQEFENKTLPLITEFKNHGYQVETLDSAPPPYQIFQKIISLLKALPHES